MKEFHSLGHFAAHLVLLDAKVALAAHHGLKRVAVAIEKTAKSEFGHYQPAVGEFSAWAPLAESTVKDRTAKGFAPDDPLLRDGKLLRDSITNQVEGMEAIVGSNEDVMVWQELGTEKLPPRAVLGPAAIRNRDLIGRVLGVAVGRAIAGQSAIEYGADGAYVALSNQ